MRIYAEVSLFATLSDGTRVSVDYKVPHDCGDNPAFAGHEAELAVEKAAKVALRSFCAQVQPEHVQPRRSMDDMRNHPRDYVIGKLEAAGVPVDADAATARDMMVRNINWSTVVTDEQLESFQALRRQIHGGAS